MVPAMQALEPFATSSWAASRCPARQLTASLHFIASKTATASANVLTVYPPSDCGSSLVVGFMWFFQYPGVKRVPVPPPHPGTTALIEEYMTKVEVPVTSTLTSTWKEQVAVCGTGRVRVPEVPCTLPRCVTGGG